jgi:hypothetical protein
MANLFHLISTLVDKSILTNTDMNELMGSSYHPRYPDLLDILVEKGVLETADREELKKRDYLVLKDHLRLKGILD